MSDKDNILVIIELDNSPHAIVDRAVRVAKLMDCELELLLCDPTLGTPFLPFAYTGAGTWRTESMTRLTTIAVEVERRRPRTAFRQ